MISKQLKDFKDSKKQLKDKIKEYLTDLLERLIPEDLLDWIKAKYDKVDTLYYKIEKGVKNLWDWVPTIWKLRNWDSHFIYMVLRKQLELMEKNFRKYGVSVDSTREANDMRVCIDILDRLIEDEYEERALEEHDKKWGNLDMSFEPLDSTKEWSRCIITRPNIKNDEDAEQEKLEFCVCINKAEIDIQEDLKVLFNNIRYRIRYWWD